MHGIHHAPKTYVPPFMKDEVDQMRASYQDASPEKIKNKMYEIEIEQGFDPAAEHESPLKVSNKNPQDQKPQK